MTLEFRTVKGFFGLRSSARLRRWTAKKGPKE